MKKAIIFLFLTLALFANSLFCGNHDFNAKANTEALLKYVDSKKLTFEKFKEVLESYEIESGIQPNVQDTTGNTILHYLVQRSDDTSLNKIKKDCLKFFVEKYAHKIDINIINNNSVTALKLGLIHKNHEALDTILEKCIDRMNAKTALSFLRCRKDGHSMLLGSGGVSLGGPSWQQVYFDDYSKHFDKIDNIASEWKNFAFTSFLYGLMMPIEFSSLVASSNERPGRDFLGGFLYGMAIGACSIGGFASCYISMEERDRKLFSSTKIYLDHLYDQTKINRFFKINVLAFVAGICARLWLALAVRGNKIFPGVNAWIYNNGKMSAMLNIAISAVSTVALHKIRSTPEGEQ